MRKPFIPLISLLLVAALLAGCGAAPGASSASVAPAQPAADPTEDAAAMAALSETVGAAALQLNGEATVFSHWPVARARHGSDDVLVFMLDDAATAEGDGFIAITFAGNQLFYSADAALKNAAFVEVARQQDDGAGYAATQQATTLADITFLPGQTDEPRPQVPVSAQWLRTLRDATWADWQAETTTSSDWALAYCENLLAFFASTGVPVPATYADATALMDGITAAAPAQDERVYLAACRVMGLDAEHYDAFIQAAAPQ